jgi:hypothetical protein
VPRLVYDVEDPTRLRASLESMDTFVDDRDRNRWLPAGAFSYPGLTYSAISSAAVPYYGIELADAVDTSPSAILAVPSTWVNGSIAVTAYIANSSAAAGNARLSLFADSAPANAALATTGILAAAAVAAPAQNRFMALSSTSSHAVDANDDLIFVLVSRNGAHASDTLAGSLALLGMLITYTPS